MIQALRDAAYHRQIPDFKREPYDLGSFDDIAYYRGGRGGRAQDFSACLEFSDPGRHKSSSGRFDITFVKKGVTPVPYNLRISDSRRSTWVEHKVLNQDIPKLRVRTPNGKGEWRVPTLLLRGDSEKELPLFEYFRFFFVVEFARGRWTFDDDSQPDGKDKKLIERLYRSMRRMVRNRNETLYASAPVRSNPQRTYNPSRLIRESEGNYIPMYLANLYSHDAEQWDKIKKGLETYGRESGLFDDISVRLLGKKGGDPFQILIRKKGAKTKGPARNLADVGYGVSQALPVIAELLREDPPSVCLLQQPEVHLHPSAQAALGSLFCKFAESGRQLIVETHSDYLMDRVRMDVRDRITTLKPEDVSILYFERKDLSVCVHSIRIDKQGNICDAPRSYRSFFMKETRRSIGL